MPPVVACTANKIPVPTPERIPPNKADKKISSPAMVISGKTYKETDKDTVAINVLLIKFHPFKRQAARNNGIFSNVFVSHKGISNRLLNMIATPDTPPVTRFTGS